MWVCAHAWSCVQSQRCQILPELELQATVSHQMWLELWSMPDRVVGALSY